MSNLIYLKDHASPQTSSKYQFLDTREVIQFFESEGCTVSKTGMSKVLKNKESRTGYQKHFALINLPEAYQIPDRGKFVTPQILLINSYEGTSSLKMLLALNVGVCSNGLVTYSELFHSVRITHLGPAKELLNHALEDIKEAAVNLSSVIQGFQSKQLPVEKYVDFARRASMFRLQDRASQDNFLQSQFRDLLKAHRQQDTEDNLWTVFNVIQENLMRGGMSYQYWGKNKQGEKVIKTQKLRPIRSIDSKVRVNQWLWSELEKLAA